MKVLSLLRRNGLDLNQVRTDNVGLNESPELIAQEYVPAYAAQLSASPPQ